MLYYIEKEEKMPKAIQYKSNSVIYFAGDSDYRVFLLQKGKLVLSAIDIETGMQINEYIREGEFFGVKSALGKFPREESVMVVADSVCLTFSTAEFELFAQNNTRIVMKMLKVFSNQLRHIHHQIESILKSEEQTNPDDGMYSVALAFCNSQDFGPAAEVAMRYLQLFPSGKHISEMKQLVQKGLVHQDKNNGVSENGIMTQPKNETEAKPEEIYSMAEKFEEQGKLDEALRQYQAVISNADETLKRKAYLKAIRCLYKTENYNRGIQTGTNFISSFPSSPEIPFVLVEMGNCYKKLNQMNKAEAFYAKAAAMNPQAIPGGN